MSDPATAPTLESRLAAVESQLSNLVGDFAKFASDVSGTLASVGKEDATFARGLKAVLRMVGGAANPEAEQEARTVRMELDHAEHVEALSKAGKSDELAKYLATGVHPLIGTKPDAAGEKEKKRAELQAQLDALK